jgi:chromosome segregation ATPase
VDELQNKTSTSRADITLLKSDMLAVKSNLTSQAATLSSHSATLSSHTGTLNSHATTLSSHTSQLADHATRVLQLESGGSNHTSDITSIQNIIQNIQQTIGYQTGSDNNQTISISTIESQIQILNGFLSQYNSSLILQESEIAALSIEVWGEWRNQTGTPSAPCSTEVTADGGTSGGGGARRLLSVNEQLSEAFEGTTSAEWINQYEEKLTKLHHTIAVLQESIKTIKDEKTSTNTLYGALTMGTIGAAHALYKILSTAINQFSSKHRKSLWQHNERRIQECSEGAAKSLESPVREKYLARLEKLREKNNLADRLKNNKKLKTTGAELTLINVELLLVQEIKKFEVVLGDSDSEFEGKAALFKERFYNYLKKGRSAETFKSLHLDISLFGAQLMQQQPHLLKRNLI